MNATQWLIAVQIVVTVVFAGISWLFRRAVSDMDRRQADAERRIDRLEQNAVNKEDWLREANIARKQLTDMGVALAEIKGQNNVGLQIGAALQGLLAVMKTQVNNGG